MDQDSENYRGHSDMTPVLPLTLSLILPSSMYTVSESRYTQLAVTVSRDVIPETNEHVFGATQKVTILTD